MDACFLCPYLDAAFRQLRQDIHLFIRPPLYLLILATGTIITSVNDAVAVAFQVVESAKNELVWLIPPSLLSLSSTYNMMDKVKVFIQNGGVLRGITMISRANVEEMRLRLGIGENVRYAGQYQEVFMLIGDKQHSISAINIGTPEYAHDTRIVAIWSEDPVYAQ